MNVQDFLTCLAKTESNDNPNAPLGDHGRALGRFQVHPDWVHTQEVAFGLQPTLNETWDSFITRLVTAFFNRHIAVMDEIEVAMYFHMGHRMKDGDSNWDMGYADRFQTFAADFER